MTGKELFANNFSDRVMENLKDFPLFFTTSLPLEVLNQLKTIPDFMEWYDPNVPRYVWIDLWQKAVEEARAYNKKIISEYESKLRGEGE